MDLSLFTLSFRGELEKEFREDHFNSSIRLYRFAYFSGFLYFGLYVILDILVLPDIKDQLSFIRFIVVCPVLLIIFFLSFTKGFRKYWQFASVFSTFLTSMAIIAMIIISPKLGQESYYAGIILVLIYGYLLVNVRFIYAAIAGWIIVLSFAFVSIFFLNINEQVKIVNIFFLTSTNILGMLGSYSLEYYTRRSFFHRYLLEVESKKVEMANMQLEAKVNEKTKELQQELLAREEASRALVLAKEKAEKSDRLKSAFLANMSHEIRTPMNGIIGFSNLLKNPDLNGEKQSEYIEIIQQSGLRMLDTISDLINISKIEAGLVELNLNDENINQIVSDLTLFFSEEAEQKGLDFRFISKLPERYEYISSDREKLISVFSNLIKNAIKFTNEGKIEFGFNPDSVSKKNEIEFFIRDTGIGIPENSLESIFDRFVQEYSTRKQFVEGSGLGLSITKSYIDLLGGSIRAESEVEKGSEFRFTIPYIESEKKQHTNGTTHIESNTAFEWMKDKTILIVEDEPTSILYLESILRKRCKELLIANDGDMAVETARANSQTDLILMDIRMPNKNGYDATREIRKFNKDVIIIAQTANALESDRQKALQAGCNDYIAKPLNAAKLLAVIEQQIRLV